MLLRIPSSISSMPMSDTEMLQDVIRRLDLSLNNWYLYQWMTNRMLLAVMICMMILLTGCSASSFPLLHDTLEREARPFSGMVVCPSRLVCRSRLVPWKHGPWTLCYRSRLWWWWHCPAWSKISGTIRRLPIACSRAARGWAEWPLGLVQASTGRMRIDLAGILRWRHLTCQINVCNAL